MTDSKTRSLECAECGAVIDLPDSSSEPEHVAPCLQCGSTKRRVFLSLSNAQPTNYFLDKFVAHKLSELTICGALEIDAEPNWLGNFIFRTAFIGMPAEKDRAYVFNYLRRAGGALHSYRQARQALIEHLNTPRNDLSHYFKALLNFEVSIAQCYQALEILKTATGQAIFTDGDGSPYERLHTLYIDSKHMDRMIDGGKLPSDATAALWITNDGLGSGRGKVSFVELDEILRDMFRLAQQLSNPSEETAK